jgi:hypothetical protein
MIRDMTRLDLWGEAVSVKSDFSCSSCTVQLRFCACLTTVVLIGSYFLFRTGFVQLALDKRTKEKVGASDTLVAHGNSFRHAHL